MIAAMMLSIFDAKQQPAGSSSPSSAQPNTGEILTPRTPLLLRGHTMERSAMADGERRGSGISHSDAALITGPSTSSTVDGSSSDATPSSAGSTRRASSIRLPAFNMNNVLAAGDDELDGLVTGRRGGQSARLASHRDPAAYGPTSTSALSVSVPPQQRAPLMLQAALALWRLRDEARGFRKWKDVLAEPLDLRAQMPELPPSVTVADEARRLLLNAETKRQVARARRLGSSDSINVSGQAGVASSASLAASFARAESNLLVLWAREAHAKSFRDVDDLTLREVMRYLRLRQYQDGELLFFEGDAGDQFYLLLDGTVAVYSGASAAIKNRPAVPASTDSKKMVVEDLAALGRRVFTYRAGESFGETAMFTKDATRTASAVAAGVCEVLELAKDVYLRTLKRFHRQYYERARRLHFAQRVRLFREWPRSRVAAVAEVLELKRLSFGDRLLVEGAVAPSACFLVLSGALKLTTQVALDEATGTGAVDSDDDREDASSNVNGAGASSSRQRPQDSASDISAFSAWTPASPTSKRTKKQPELRKAPARRGGAVTIALHSALAGEFVAVESVLHPGSCALYSAVADSADVEVYALAESDARALLGGAGSVVYQQMRQMADAAARQRQMRLEAARRALRDRDRRNHSQFGLARLEEGGFCDAELISGGEIDPQRPEVGAAAVDSELQQDQKRQSRAAAAEHVTYVPHLDTSRLLAAAAGASPSLGSVTPCSALMSPSCKWLNRDDKSLAVDLDVRAAAPPRMLSTCVKNFVFANSDTLASDYAKRLQLQFPLPSPRQQHPFLLSTSPSATMDAASMTAWPSDSPGYSSPNHHHRRHRSQQQQQQQQLLDQHMRRLYETKMHWDATRKSFVLVPPPVADSIASSTTATATATPTKTRGMTASTAAASLTSEPLCRQQRAAQETARRLLDERARKQSEKRAPMPGREATTSSFVHFF